jgi:hypothetical protein
VTDVMTLRMSIHDAATPSTPRHPAKARARSAALRLWLRAALLTPAVAAATLIGLDATRPVCAQVVERRVSAAGTGPSRGHAIHDALINASSQAFGMRLQASSITSMSSSQINVDTASQNVLVDAFNRRIAREVRTPGDRPILGFTVDQAERDASGLWSVRVTIRHSDYQKLGAPSDRRAVAVHVKPHPQAAALLRAVEPALVATRRFDVLSRDAVQAFDREARFLRSGDAAAGELARLGQGLGADYIAVVEFDGLRVVDNQQERIALSGETYVRSQISGAIRLEIVEMATRKKKWTGRESIAAVYEGAPRVDAELFAQRLEDAATALVARMTSVIYPIEVVRVEGDRFYINRGEGAVLPGERLQVVTVGAELRDPQSGESLGELETPVGVAEVVEVSARFATAAMLQGRLQQGGRYRLRALPPPPVAGPANPGMPGPGPAPAAPPPADNRLLLNR